MGEKCRKYKVLKVNRKCYRFIMRYGVLLCAVAVGMIVLAITGHKEYQALLGAGGVARALELAGEAAADAFDDY